MCRPARPGILGWKRAINRVRILPNVARQAPHANCVHMGEATGDAIEILRGQVGGRTAVPRERPTCRQQGPSWIYIGSCPYS